MRFDLESSTALLFAMTFFAISITPGLCMMLSMSLGAYLGVRRTMWMMAGELLAMSFISLVAMFGLTTIYLKFDYLLDFLKYLGISYLLYIGYMSWNTKVESGFDLDTAKTSPGALFISGVMTAISNPKAWVFMITILPPFIKSSKPMVSQVATLLLLIILIEFSCLMIYAYGGSVLQKFFYENDKAYYLNRVSGVAFMTVAVYWFVSTYR